MCVYTHTLEKDGNRLEEISGLAEKSLWNIGLYENCMWNYVNYVCWVLASWLSWSLLSFSPNCSFSWNCSLVKACKIFFFSLLTDFFKKKLCKKKCKKLFSYIFWDYILWNKSSNDRGSIWNRKTNSFFNGYGSPIKIQFLMFKFKKKKKMRRNSWHSANNCVWRFVPDFVILSKARYQSLGIMYKGKKKVDMYKPQRWLLG